MTIGLSLIGDEDIDRENDSLYLSKDEALRTEVLPRSYGGDVKPRTAISTPSSSASMQQTESSDLFSLSDLMGSTVRQPSTSETQTAKPSELFSVNDLMGIKSAPTTTPVEKAPAEDTGDFMRGAGTALAQTPALAYGALGLVGAAGEKAFGTGGAMSSLKKFGLDQYQTRMKEIGATAKESDDVTKAWEKAKQGDIGALADWAQYGIGYLGGNIVETVATSALGSAIGGFTAGPAGAVAGAGAGVVGRQAVQGVAKNLIEGMVAKEAARIAEKAGVEVATGQMLKEATKNVAKGIGSSMALVGSSLIKETGGIYGEAEEQAAKEGRELDGGDLARIFGSGVVAGLSEFAVDKLGLDVAAGKIKIPGGGRTGRSIIGGAAGVGFEGGTELFQTAVERFGAGKALTGEDAMNEYINAFALGGLGGGTVGAAVGAFRDGKTSPDRVRQILDQAQADMTSDDGRQELFDSMYDDPNLGSILQANNIESGDDPRFQSVVTRALATQRMLVDLEAPTPEVRAETRKQREADILAAFGETASTAVGGDTGAIEPVIQRASVTPNLETRTLEGEAQPVILPETAGGQAGTVALSPEDLVARQQGFEPLIGITTDKGPVGNRFPSPQAAETFLFGPKDAKTGQRSGGYAQTNLVGQGLEARIRQGKRSKTEGGGTFYFVETRKKPVEAAPAAAPAAPVVTPSAPVTTAAAPVVTPAAPAVTPAVTPAVPVTPTKGKKAAIPALTQEEEQQQIPLRVRAEEIANELETLGGDKNLISGIRSVVSNKRRIQNNDFYEGKLAELKALKGAGVQKTTEKRGVSDYLSGSKREQGRYDEYKGNADIGPFLQSADDAIQQLTTFVNNLGYAVADVNNATPDKRALFAKNLMSQIAGSTTRMLLKREAFDKKYKNASLEQKNKSLVDLQKDLVAAQEYITKQGEPDATQARQVTEGGEQQRQGAGEQVPAVGEDRGVKAEEQTGGGETGGGDQPVEGGTQPQEVKPAVDPVMQARVKERINRADEDGGLDFEDVVKLNKMVDDGDLMGAINSMKKIVESNLGAGAGAKYSLSRAPQPTTTGRDFAYGKLKTVDDLNKNVRGYLAAQGITDSFTAARVPIGNLAGKIPGLPSMQRIADLFGKKLVYFAVEKGSVDFIDGAVLSGSDTIFINVNSTRPHIRVLGHEMVHALRFSNKEIYTALTKHLSPYLDQGGMNAYRAQLNKEGMKDPALILEEAIGDIVGDRFGESSFWQMMADENPSMFTQLARIVVDFLDSVMSKIRSKQTLDSKNLLTDVAAARQAIVSVLADFEQKQPTAPAKPTGLPSFSQKRMDLPAEFGTQPIPDGYVRLYHQTDTESLDKIAKEGLSIKYAKGIEGPRAIYAGETPFYGPVETRPTLEFVVPKDQWDAPFVLQDVQPNQIIAAHYPWHRRVRYLEDADNQDVLQKALAGEFDNLEGDYKLAVEYVKDKYGKPAEEAAPTMFSRKPEGETFYSAMERGFESVKQASMPAQQWKSWLNSNKAQLGIKNAEIEWTGINEWLDLQEGKVEKQTVLNWIAGNKVQLNDIILTGSGRYISDDDLRDAYVAASDEFIEDVNLSRQELLAELGYPADMQASGPQHKKLTLPNGKDYFELILTEPSIDPYKSDDDIHFGDLSDGKQIGWIRGNIRKDKDGNSVLFLEEIQSQRAQEGRERGFVEKIEVKRTLYGRWRDAIRSGEVKTEGRKKFLKWFNTQPESEGVSESEAIQKYQFFLRARLPESAFNLDDVPVAPFVGETKSWVSLLMKRAIAYAQSKGIDRVSWTTGDQQNDRYRLSRSIDEIYYDPYEDGKTFEVTALKDGNEVGQGSGQMGLESIRRTYGKDIAKMMVDGVGEQVDDTVKAIRGENLDAGGAGMREFYNTIVPSVAKSIVGKDSVTVMELEDTGQQLGFVIPEKLQEQVANDGFPMFSRKRYEDQFSDVSPDTRERALNKGFYSPPTIKERLDRLRPNFAMRIVQGTFDKFRSVRDISQKAYLMLRMSSGSQDGAVSALLHYGQVFNDDGALNVKKGTQGLLEVLDPVGGEVDRFLLWIAANRAAALSKDERERFFSPEDIKSLRGLNMGTMKNGKSRLAVYAETLKNMNELNRSVLDVARDTGLIDAEGYKRFSADIWYIPFYRQMEDDGSLSAAQTSSGAVGQYLSKKLKGSERPLNDLMENVLMNWTHILSASMKNQAAVETLTSATAMGDIVTKLERQEKGAVKVMEKGKETFYRIDDEFLLTSLSAVAQMPSYGWGMDIMRGFKTTLTRFISLSPTFKINNLIRDSIQSIGLSELSRNPIGNVMQGWRAYKTERAEALAGGGLFAMGNAFDGDQSASVKRLLKTGVNKADILDTPEKVASFFGKMQDKYDEVSDASENANRLALYQQLRAKGASHLEASYAARDLQDFSLQGSWSAIRYAAQVLPYFNARLQGLYKLGRDGLDPTIQVLTGKASDTERQKAAKFATVTGAVVAVAMILYLSQKDDEDWKKREDWDRDAFFWFKIPGTQTAVRIPKPFEMGAIATLVERFTEQMADSSVEGKVFAKRLGAVFHDTFAVNPIPQAIRPLYDIARNKDGFTDRPIESMGMERISVENRVSPGTSAAAVALGTVNSLFAEFASKATGGAISTQSTQLSPIQYDYLLKGYLGWVGTVIQTASNVAATPFKDGASSRYERIDDFLVVGNYVKTVPQSQSRYVTSFYENAKDIATATSDVSHFLNSGQLEKAKEAFVEKSDKIALAKLYTKGTNMMSTIGKQVRIVEDDPKMSGAEKRLEIERLQQLRIQIAKDVEDIRIAAKK